MTSDQEDGAPTANVDAPRRRIRSYVIRAGRMTAGQERAWQALWPVYGIEYSPEPLDLDRRFGRSAPRMMEIGFGTGDALIAFAQQHPEFDCLGVEVHPPGVGRALIRIDAEALGNVRVICHDAVEVLSCLPDHSLDEVHLFFPDPWHKKRHHKRRLIQPAFVDAIARVMKLSGVLKLATDWENYAQHMRTVLDTHDAFANVAQVDLGIASGFAERPPHRPLTRFERRGHRLGHGVWDLAYRRR